MKEELCFYDDCRDGDQRLKRTYPNGIKWDVLDCHGQYLFSVQGLKRKLIKWLKDNDPSPQNDGWKTVIIKKAEGQNQGE